MKIEEKKIGDIFTTNASADKYTIPDYQRPYVWNQDRTEEYFNDLLSEGEDNLPFLGSFILQKRKDGYDIVDGQQRFITTSILIAVLRDVSKELCNKKSISDDTKKRLENFTYNATSRLIDTDNLGTKLDVILKVWSEHRDFFEQHILSNQESFKDLKKKPKKKEETKYNIYKNYHKLWDLIDVNLENNNAPEVFLNNLMTKLSERKIVAIFVDKDVEAYTAFEIVNARGQVLGNIDLLKNLFYKSASAVDDLDWMKNSWDQMISHIEGSSGVKVNTESFLKFFWHSYFGGSSFTTAKTLFSKYKHYIQEKGYRTVAQQLLENAELFKTFFDSNQYDWTDESKYNQKILVSLKFIRAFNITQSYILFLSIIRNKLDSKKVKNIIEATEKFHFAYSVVSKKQANKVEKLYGKFAEDFENADQNDPNKIGTIYNQFINKLEELFPRESEFLENFYELTYTKKKDAIRYVFYKIHEFDSKGATVLNFASSEANLEHIIPQKNNSSSLSDSLIHSIGNIMPLSRFNNSRAGNKDLKEKIQDYKDSGTSIPIISEVIERIENNNYSWEENDIKEWAEYLGKQTYKITKKLK